MAVSESHRTCDFFRLMFTSGSPSSAVCTPAGLRMPTRSTAQAHKLQGRRVWGLSNDSSSLSFVDIYIIHYKVVLFRRILSSSAIGIVTKEMVAQS